jgi:RNA polymerase primary sigma factor
MRKNIDSEVLKDYYREIKDIPVLTSPEESELSQIIKTSPQDSFQYKRAVDTLVRANLKFCVKIAKEYQNIGFELSDIIGYANEGILEAAKRFDDKKNTRFISYAVWWIRQKIKRKVSEDNLIKLPANAAYTLSLIHSIWNQFYPYRTDPPSYKEIGSYIDISEEKYYAILKSKNLLSLQTLVSQETDSLAIQDFIEDIQRPNPEYVVEQTLLQERILSRMQRLTAREQELIKDRFGLDGRVEHTLSMVGKKMHLTKERVRQIQNKALQKLSQDKELQGLFLAYNHPDIEGIVGKNDTFINKV